MEEIGRNMKVFIQKFWSCENIILWFEYTLKNTQPGAC